MKYSTLVLGLGLFVLVCSLQGCTEEDTQTTPEEITIDLGTFNLLETSIEQLDQLNKDSVRYVDAEGNFRTLHIQKNASSLTQVLASEGESKYEYMKEEISWKITNEQLNVDWDFKLNSEPTDFNRINTGRVDQLQVWISMPGDYKFVHKDGSIYTDDVDGTIEKNMLTLPVDVRTSGLDYSRPLSSFTIVDKDFERVYKGNDNLSFPNNAEPETGNSIPIIYYNFEIGIVGFMDRFGKLWRIDKAF